MKILFLMHIDWNWIKQRPHFIAENLDANSDVNLQIYYRPAYHTNLLSKNDSNLKNPIRRLPKLPFSSNSVLITSINSWMEYLVLRNEIKKADVIYITHPSFQKIAKYASSKIIVYDCMDDIVEFSLPSRIKKFYSSCEKKIIERVSLVTYTAAHLKDTIEYRYGIKAKNDLILNNALNIPSTTESDNKYEIDTLFKPDKTDIKTITYIGTISKWLDYESLIKVVEGDQSIRFFLFGPCEVSFPKHPQIKFLGTRKHSDVFYIMEKSDALIMPFVVNKLILSVNPVKLYEYVYSTKPVISVRYQETEKFSDYAYLYSNASELISIVNRLKENGFKSKANKDSSIEFVKSNTWNHRATKLMNKIKEII